MRTNILCGVSLAMLIAALGCGGGDSGESNAVASNSSAPPAPPSAPAASGATAAPPAPASDGAEGSSSPDGAAYPGGSSGYPGGSGSAGAYPGGPSGYPGGSGGYPGDTGDSDSSGGYPGGSPSPYPGGSPQAGADGYPSGYPGYPGEGGIGATPLARPKTLRQKAVDAFRAGRSDEGVQLLSAHYLTSPSAGSELGRVMQWGGPILRKPTLVTRIGLAVVYSSQPPTFEGHPQPIGSPELEASMESMERAKGGNREGTAREGGNPRVGKRRLGGRPAGEENPGASGPPGGAGFEDASGYGGGQNQMPTSPEEELKYFTGEVGTKLVAKIKTKLEAGEFGAIYREALKSSPLAVGAGQGGAFGPGGVPGGYSDLGPDGELQSAPPFPGGGPGGPGQPGQGQLGQGGEAGGVITGQVIPGVEFLGAVENVKELGELIKSSSVDAVIYFEVRVRPATANTFVNNDTNMRLVAAADPSKQLLSPSIKLNNKQVHLDRKSKKGGAEDPVAKEVDAVVAALETSFKHVPLPALTAEQVQKRIDFLLKSKPEDATSLLLETRLFVAKKLLKPEDAVTLALTSVSDDQLSSISDVIEEGDVKELLGSALTGKRADAPTTVLGKFGAALSGAGGIGNLIPTPQLPPMGMPRGAGGPGGYGPQSGYPQGGYPSGPGGYPPPGSGPPAGSSSGFSPAPGGPPPERGGSSSEDR